MLSITTYPKATDKHLEIWLDLHLNLGTAQPLTIGQTALRVPILPILQRHFQALNPTLSPHDIQGLILLLFLRHRLHSEGRLLLLLWQSQLSQTRSGLKHNTRSSSPSSVS